MKLIKRFLLIAAALLVIVTELAAQSPGDFDNNAITTLSLQSQFSPRFVYCLIVGRQSLSNSGKFSIEIEYGDNKELGKDNRIKDDDGKVKVFTSMVDPLNMLAKDGWEFVQAYSVMVNQQNVYHYVMRRPAQ
ncbi:MAG: hypothetical protein QM762_13555 [Chryseolinea sp.]